MQITKITIARPDNLLKLEFSDGFSSALSFEFVRVYAPTESQKQQKQPGTLVTHKKDVVITAIESVGRHGYRLIFNDGFKDIFPVTRLRELSHNQERLWQDYLDQLGAHPHSREPLIEIKEVK